MELRNVSFDWVGTRPNQVSFVIPHADAALVALPHDKRTRRVGKLRESDFILYAMLVHDA